MTRSISNGGSGEARTQGHALVARSDLRYARGGEGGNQDPDGHGQAVGRDDDHAEQLPDVNTPYENFRAFLDGCEELREKCFESRPLAL